MGNKQGISGGGLSALEEGKSQAENIIVKNRKAIHKLKIILDSLNLQISSCDEKAEEHVDMGEDQKAKECLKKKKELERKKKLAETRITMLKTQIRNAQELLDAEDVVDQQRMMQKFTEQVKNMIGDEEEETLEEELLDDELEEGDEDELRVPEGMEGLIGETESLSGNMDVLVPNIAKE